MPPSTIFLASERVAGALVDRGTGTAVACVPGAAWGTDVGLAPPDESGVGLVAESVVESDEHAIATTRSNDSNAKTGFIVTLVLRL